ncbi:MAG: glucose 1-dehydrogenase [Acidimicrobiia bacterium]|nr:glucose 1-dehydrogenase [Acidimicrobiia bacterium]MYB45137.1 glucose 1-dehydrogenase [Acidimicrobiia bacterium]MYC84591.1 glucose 1-dehydrogenase [Acidimicrobiia bacterium]
MRLEGKAAVVTGAGQGIGAAIARLFAAEGARLVLADMRSGPATGVVDEITSGGGEAVFVQADVTSDADCKRMIDTAIEGYGTLDILVNNAGIAGKGTVTEVTEEFWDRVMAVNLKSIFLASRHAVPHMERAGGGSIVCIASVAGMTGEMGQVAYNTSKHGVIGLVRCMAYDHAAAGIRVNAVCPGAIDTPLLSPLTEERRTRLEGMHMMRRLGRPEEIARAVLYLAGDESSFMTGAAHVVDGGYTAF